MGLPYRMNDGSVIFLTPKDRNNPPTQEEAQAIYDAMQAERASRDPADVAYGQTIIDRRLKLNLGLGELADQLALNDIQPIDWSPAKVSSIERGRSHATDAERLSIERFFAGRSA